MRVLVLLFFSFLFSFTFFFLESYDYCFRVQNPTCSLRYGIEKTPNYPREKANPPSPSGMEPTGHLAPNKKPLTSGKDRRKESNQRTSRKSQENPWHDDQNKGKTKSKRSGDHLKIPHTQCERGKARHD